MITADYWPDDVGLPASIYGGYLYRPVCAGRLDVCVWMCCWMKNNRWLLSYNMAFDALRLLIGGDESRTIQLGCKMTENKSRKDVSLVLNILPQSFLRVPDARQVFTDSAFKIETYELDSFDAVPVPFPPYINQVYYPAFKREQHPTVFSTR